MHFDFHTWVKPLFLCGVLVRQKLQLAFLGLASKIRFQKSITSISVFTQKAICPESIFRYLLQIEQKRAQRSGHAYYILLVYKTGKNGMVARIESSVANEIFKALAQSLRDTDYIGWYREGHIAAGVLTVVGSHSPSDVLERLKRRLIEIIQNGRENQEGYFQIKLCHGEELQEGEVLNEKLVAVNI
jgi:hypothetical protein